MNVYQSVLGLVVCLATTAAASAEERPAVAPAQLLDGEWQLAVDPRNVGREQSWFAKPSPEAKTARVPWIIQTTFPGYHGVAWYWREFAAPANPHPNGRYLLRFWQVDYLAEVWLNGQPVGGHEGGETPFVLDVTAAIKPGAANRLAVRVLNPTVEPIDGIGLHATARRCKVIPYRAGAGFNHGGITDSVELLCVPEVCLKDLFVTATPSADQSTGRVHIEAVVHNAATEARQGSLDFTLSSGRSGETTAAVRLQREFAAGDTTIESDLVIDNPRLWDLADPYLYRVTARAAVDGTGSFDEQSTRCGFRDFRFDNGYFRLNGRRIYLRCSHTCNHYPIGLQFPQDPDLLRRDMLNMKVMGFNAIRFIWGGSSRAQLDLCDEIGLLVYNESYAAWPIGDSPKMAERFDTAVSELIRRDRNHPSLVIWGLLNETHDGPTFRHAVAMLPRIRSSLDASRMVMLNSGRWDERPNHGAIGSVPGLRLWPKNTPGEPWVALNATKETIHALGITWPAGHLALHPGPGNEFSVVRWTAPAAGEVQIDAAFTGLAGRATTDVHVLHRGHSLVDGRLNLEGSPNDARFSKALAVAQGDTLDFVVGSGNNHYGGDTTGLSLMIKTRQKTYDAAAEFATAANPNGAWSYGQMAPAPAPAASTFVAYDGASDPPGTIGSLANPGSSAWEDVVRDYHNYPRVPHTADILQSLRTLDGKGQPVFLSEYGIGSAVDLWRATRHFEQRGAEGLEDAEFFRDKLNRFLADWKDWRLDEVYARPEDFFMESLAKMAGQRTLGLNAIRSNPQIVAHSLTGAIDHVMCGEGLTTLFRELKPGTIDAMVDAWAPLRWCLFAEPAHLARGQKVRLEAVLANEDVLPPGEYPARLQVIGPNVTRIFDRTIRVTIPKPAAGQELPLAQACFAEDVAIDGPAGKYQWLVTFERGAAAAGGRTEFYVTDPAAMPTVDGEVVLWGEDPKLAQWLADHGIRTRPFSPLSQAADLPGAKEREVILASGKPPAPGGAEAFAELARHVARGSTVVFLTPQIFAEADRPTVWLPLVNKGTVAPIRGWLYLKDEWAKAHPIFEGLPAGGLMDYTYYRELIPDLVWQGQDPPTEAVAGAVKASQDYASGLMVAVYSLDEGRFVLNTLQIRENLGRHPVAERLLRNMLRYAARDLDKPLADLPTDFDRQLQGMGLQEP